MEQLNEEIKASLNTLCNKAEELHNLLEEMRTMEDTLDNYIGDSEHLRNLAAEYLEELSPGLKDKIRNLL